MEPKRLPQNFEAVLAHEVGHILGLGHPDQGAALHLKGKKASVDHHTPIHRSKMCQGLHITTPIRKPCESLFKPHTLKHIAKDACHSSPACVWDNHGFGTCRHRFSRALMASHAADAHTINSVPTEDDLASLFFLYPSRLRSEEWSTKPIPMKEYRLAKLKSIATTRGIIIGDEWSKTNILQAVLISIEEESVAKQERFNQQRPRARLKALLQARKKLLAKLKSKFKHNTKESSEDVATAQKELQAARKAAEEEDANANGDVIIGNVGDLDGDGIQDQDLDGDELPDEVESGLDALDELAACVTLDLTCDASLDEASMQEGQAAGLR